MAQQGILGRITRLARANINAMIDSAEDPQVMLDQMIRDYTGSIREAEESVAVTIGNLRMMEEDRHAAELSAEEWGEKAKAASTKADAMRRAGDAAEADRFDELARAALKKQLESEQRASELQPTIEQQRDMVEQLKVGLQGMREKLGELQTKRDELVARSRVAKAQLQVQAAVKGVDVADPTSEVARYEDRIRRQEARARGQAELAASSMKAQFDALDDMAKDEQVEERLAKIKGGA